MILLISHIIIALSSVAYATYVFFRPSKSKFYVTYALVASTLISGTYLVITNRPVHLASSCISGLTYIGIVMVAIVPAHFKLAHVKARIQ
jgi:hypothetical protein